MDLCCATQVISATFENMHDIKLSLILPVAMQLPIQI